MTAAQTPVHADERPPGRGAKRGVRNTVEWVVIIAVALLAALVIKTFLLQAFYIPSESMTPTLKVRDRVLVNKLSYHMHAVHRGDIVVFERPPGEGLGEVQIKDLIKRVVGLPGQTVEGRDGRVWVDGRELQEPYVHGAITTPFPATKLSPHHYWVMGDNRINSRDSRFFGAIDRDLIVGRAFVRVWPLSALSFL
jgi:signal peptidase I